MAEEIPDLPKQGAPWTEWVKWVLRIVTVIATLYAAWQGTAARVEVQTLSAAVAK